MFSSALSEYHIWLVLLAVINAAIGIFYYFRVIIAMYFRDAERNVLTVPGYYKVVLGISAVVTIIFGIYPGILTDLL